jgi:hypothetical protein
MCSQINYEEKAKLLLAKVREAYYDSLGDYEYGTPNADEIILKVVLSEILRSGLSGNRKIEKVLQFYQHHPEYPVQ